MPAETQKKRVLCLHGYSQNASMMSKKLAAIANQCPDVELVFIDAPHVLQPVDIPDPTQLGYFSAETVPKSEPQRGWWKTQNVQQKAMGLDETLVLMKETLMKERFDGVMGFSQGAVLAALLAALLEKPEMYPPFYVDGKAPHPKFDFCIAFAGYKPLDPLGASLLTPDYATPTLHVIGHTDIIVTPERAQSLIDVSVNKRVELHEGGHFIPTKTPWRKFLAAYLQNPAGEKDIPSPSVAGSYFNSNGYSNGAHKEGESGTPRSEPVTPIFE